MSASGAGAAAAAAALSFRARQHGGVPAVVAAHGLGAAVAAADTRADAQELPRQQAAGASEACNLGAPDTSRCVLHFDCDAFYAQVEELRNPSLRDVPMAVTQKYIIVTANYPARACGVGKLQLISAARAACPTLVLVPGEDLTPYRQVAGRFLGVLSRFGPVEKLGLDEAWVDVTAQAAAAVAAARASGAAAPPLRWVGHVHAAADAVAAHNRHRPMDLSAAGQGAAAEDDVPTSSSDALLAAGTAIAAAARAALRRELGLRASAGTAHNKLLAKLVSGLHKPDDQTALPAAQAAAFLAPLPVRCLRGVGHATETALAGLGVSTVAQLRMVPRAALTRALGDRAATALFHAARGRDASAVVPKAPPRAVSVEDSFRGVTTLAGADAVLRVLAPDLVSRCAEERAATGRRPRTLTLKWRLAPGAGGGSSARSGASAPMPDELALRSAAGRDEAAAGAAVLRAAAALLRRSLREPFCLTLLNLGATAFTDPTARTGSGAAPPAHGSATVAAAGGGDAVAAAIAADARRSYAHGGAGVQLSKRAERQLREAQPAGGAGCDDDADDELAADGVDEWALLGDDGSGSDGHPDDNETEALLRGGGAAWRAADRAAPPLQLLQLWQQAQPEPLTRQPAQPPAQARATSGLRRFFAASPAAADGCAEDAVPCATCGRMLAPEAVAEHADWHVARDLQRAELSAGAGAAAGAAPASSGRKRAAGPMDAFLRRRADG